MEIILKYWPIITGFILTALAFGKFWQILDNLSVAVKNHGEEIKQTKTEISNMQLVMMTAAKCEGNMIKCGLRNAEDFNEIKGMLRDMDSKREKSKENTADALSIITCSIGKVETKIASLEKAIGDEKQDRLREKADRK